MHNKEVRVIIAASGTGGHLFPAVYIAKAFQAKCPQLKLVFIGSGRPLEEKILGSTEHEHIKVKTFGLKNLGIPGFIRYIFSLPSALVQTFKVFRRVKPQLVIGVGGYVSVLPVVMARLLGVPTWIHEAELNPGMANKFLKYFASKISIAFKEASLADNPKAIYTGHPVRPELSQVTPGLAMGQAPRKFLVLGGSQGAKALDETLPKVLAHFKENDIEVTHQCRKENVEAVKESYQQNGINARVIHFIDNMADAYSRAHLIIARAGAGTVMEIGVASRPAIFVPYPHAQGDHQTANAMTLVKAGKAYLVQEGEDFESKLQRAIANMLNPETYFAMKLAKYESRSLNAAAKIAEECLKLI